jgi:hypothetical protein
MFESMSVVEQLREILSKADSAMHFFPHFHELAGRRTALANSAVALRQRMVRLERQIVGRHLDEARKGKLKNVLDERARMQEAYDKLPKTEQAYQGRTNEMRADLLKLQQAAYRLKWSLVEQRRELEILQTWAAENSEGLEEEVLEDFRQRLREQEDLVRSLEQLQAELEGDLSGKRGMITLATASEARDQDLRARYAANLEAERRILAVGRVSIVGREQELLEALGRQQLALVESEGRLGDIHGNLEREVLKQSEELRTLLAQASSDFARFALELKEARRATRRVAGEISTAAVAQIEEKFREIVLRGDVGVIDVAWQRKEAQTSVINDKVAQQNAELQLLDADFAEVLGD